MAPRGSSRSPERRRRRSPTPRRRKRCRSLPSESREGRRRGSRGSGRRSSRSASSSPRDRSGRGGGRRLTGRREDHPNTRSGGGSGGRRSSRRRPSSSRDLSRESHASLPPRSGRRPAVGGGHHRSTHHSRKDSPPPSSRRRRGGSSSSVSRNGASLGGRAGARGRTGGGSFAARRGTPSNSSREDRRRPLGRRRSSISESPPHRRRGGGGPFPGSGRPASPRLMRQNAMVGFPPFLRRPGEGGSGGGGPHGFYAREGGALPPVSYGRRGEGSLLPPLPPTAGSGLVPSRHPTGGPSPGGGGLSSLVHPLDPRSSNSGGGAGAGPWRGRGGSPPPEFFLARKRAKVGLAKAEEMRRQRRELRRTQRQQLQPRVDRREEPPFLLRVFYRLDAQHSLEEFKVRGEEPVQDELQVYAWMDSRLRDICHLIKDVCAEARDRGAVWHFRLVYPDREGRSAFAEVGIFHAIIPDAKQDAQTLADVKFQVGDFLVLSILRKKKGQRQQLPRPDPKLRMREGWDSASSHPAALTAATGAKDEEPSSVLAEQPGEGPTTMEVDGGEAPPTPVLSVSGDDPARTAPVAVVAGSSASCVGVEKEEEDKALAAERSSGNADGDADDGGGAGRGEEAENLLQSPKRKSAETSCEGQGGEPGGFSGESRADAEGDHPPPEEDKASSLLPPSEASASRCEANDQRDKSDAESGERHRPSPSRRQQEAEDAEQKDEAEKASDGGENAAAGAPAEREKGSSRKNGSATAASSKKSSSSRRKESTQQEAGAEGRATKNTRRSERLRKG